MQMTDSNVVAFPPRPAPAADFEALNKKRKRLAYAMRLRRVEDFARLASLTAPKGEGVEDMAAGLHRMSDIIAMWVAELEKNES